MEPSAFTQGFVFFAPLIMAVGAQNIFVLRQGALRQHVPAIVAFCFAMDALLVAAGVAGLGAVLGAAPGLRVAMALAGAGFLLWYGFGAARRAVAPQLLAAGRGASGASVGATLRQAAAFTLLNPMVYLDTVLLAGSIGAALPVAKQPLFVAGAAAASGLWFAALGFGARLVAPALAKPQVWRAIEASVFVTMVWLAGKLVLGVVPTVMGRL